MFLQKKRVRVHVDKIQRSIAKVSILSAGVGIGTIEPRQHALQQCCCAILTMMLHNISSHTRSYCATQIDDGL